VSDRRALGDDRGQGLEGLFASVASERAARSDGRTHVVLAPRESLARPCALIPYPRTHLSTCYMHPSTYQWRARGVLAACSRRRRPGVTEVVRAPGTRVSPTVRDTDPRTPEAAWPRPAAKRTCPAGILGPRRCGPSLIRSGRGRPRSGRAPQGSSARADAGQVLLGRAEAGREADVPRRDPRPAPMRAIYPRASARAECGGERRVTALITDPGPEADGGIGAGERCRGR